MIPVPAPLALALALCEDMPPTLRSEVPATFVVEPRCEFEPVEGSDDELSVAELIAAGAGIVIKDGSSISSGVRVGDGGEIGVDISFLFNSSTRYMLVRMYVHRCGS